MSETHEKETLMVSEKTAQEEAVLVKEAFGFPEPAAMPAMDAGAREERIGDAEPRSWLQSQKACDFMPFLVHEFGRLEPGRHARGRSEAERAMGQFKKLNGHISKALQSDYDGEIDLKQLEPLRQRIEESIDGLQGMLDALADLSQQRKRMRRPHRRKGSDEDLCGECGSLLWKQGGEATCVVCDAALVKEAGTPRFQGMQYQISGFERAIVGTLINGKVSGGRDIEQLYDKLKKKYGITDREELAIVQALADMGYPQFIDRAKIGEELDPTDEKNFGEWQAQYNA